ncbi:4625_t:CDS:2, partial [Gigaspora margarita]
YEVDEARWLEKEYSIANQIWLNLDIVVRKRITIENLYTSLTGGKEADRYKKRNYMARGLIGGINDSFFQEEIWLQHCNKKVQKKNSVGKGINKGEEGNPYKRFENRPRRQKSEDKRWDSFKEKM